MKKKSLLFLLYSILAVITVVLLLVFIPKIKSKVENDDKYPNPPAEESEEYVTFFAVNLPTNINILLNNFIVLNDDYITLIPNSMIEKVSITIEVIEGSSDGLEFSDNRMMANETGSYEIKFSVPSSATTFFTKSIYVNVHNNLDVSHIKPIKSSVIIDETNNLFDIFNFDINSNYTINTSSNISISNNELIGNSVGDGFVSFTFVEGNVEYYYTYNLKVKDIPEYRIVLNDILNNTIELNNNQIFFINYSILNRDDENVNQVVSVVSEDSNIVIVQSVMNPLIKIKAVSQGETAIRLELEENKSIYIEIIVIVN